MRLRSLLAFGLLTAAVCWVATAEAQPGRGPGGPANDTARLQAEIQKLKAALAEAEAKLEKAKQPPPGDSAKLAEALKKLLEGDKKGSDTQKGGFDKFGWGNWGGKGNFEKGGFERGWTPNGLQIPVPSESDKLIQAIKELLEKEKKAPAKAEATKVPSIEQRLDALQKSLDELRKEIRKR